MLQFAKKIWEKIMPTVEKVLIVAFLMFCGVAAHKVYLEMLPVEHSATLALKPTDTYYDHSGDKHTTITSQPISKAEMKRLTDSIRRDIKGKPQIKEVAVYVPVVDTEWRDLPVVIHGDTIQISKVDSYVDAKATVYTELKRGVISLKMRDTLTQVTTFKRHLFTPSTYTVDIKNKSPYTKIVAGSSAVVKENRTLLVIGPSVVYNPFTQKMQYGIGVTFNVFSIKSK